jgi:uncharacterized protein (TIGR03435 family)
MMAMLRSVVAITVVLGVIGSAQEPAPLRRFDVVSVRPDFAGTGGAGDAFPKNGTWRWTRIPMNFLAMYAYGVSLKQIEGIPDVFQSRETAFDIVAKMPANVTDDDFRAMLQSMLAERFKFAVHREMRDVPVNTVEVAKGGPNLRPASGECVPVPHSGTVAADQFRCGEVTHRIKNVQQNVVVSDEHIGRSVSIADLAKAMSGNGPVVDDTGIEGRYDIDVTIETRPLSSADGGGDFATRQLDYQSSLRAAFTKQAGPDIDLTRFRKRPLPVIVVDHVEMPDPN